jgi:hypothetical protein
MRRSLASFASLVVALALAGCPERSTPPEPAVAPPPAGTTTPPGPRPREPAPPLEPAPVLLPGYEDVKVGQRYVYALAGGMSREDEVVARTDDAITIRQTMNGDASERTELTLPLKRSPSEAAPPPAAPPAAKETLTISGRAFECDVFESGSGDAQSKRWSSKKYPFQLKIEAEGKVAFELREIK